MSRPPTIGVIIVSYNTRALLAGCLHSLRDCRLPLATVVVDNASTDGSAAMVCTDFPEVAVCALQENIGFAAANNVGLRRLGYNPAGGPTADGAPALVLFLNPDTVVHVGAIETLAAFLAAHPRVGVVSPRLYNPDGSLQHGAFRFPTLSMSLLDVFPPGEVLPGRLYGSWWHGRYPQEQNGAAPFAIGHPLGACMLARGATLAAVGAFDERYFMYSEEIDWCWRVRQAGWAIWQEPRAQVTHIGGAATRRVRRRMLVELHRSRIVFFTRHYPPAWLRAHRWITRAGMLRLILAGWVAYGRGAIDGDELRLRLLAYSEVARL